MSLTPRDVLDEYETKGDPWLVVDRVRALDTNVALRVDQNGYARPHPDTQQQLDRIEEKLDRLLRQT